MTVAALSDNLPFYDNFNEVKPCEYCEKPMVRQEFKQPPSHFRRRKTCSKICRERLKAWVFPGQQWGDLTVLSEGEPYIQPSGYTYATWVCLCVCKNQITVRTSDLKNNKVKSCGCWGGVSPNQKFDRLKTVKKGNPCIDSNGDQKIAQRTTWVCQCDCGITMTVRARDLKQGQVTSCGCKTSTRLEDTIERSLNRLNVSYKKEHKPKLLADKGFRYYLDFYLPEHKVNIEADGNTWHRDGNKHESAKDQIAYDRYRNWWVKETLNCYVLRLSEDFLDYKPWNFLDNRLEQFLNSTLKPSPKDRPWSRVTYWTLNSH